MFKFLLFGLSSSQRLSTLAGSIQGFSDNNVPTSASFYSPKQLVIDSSNNIFIIDSNNNAIRMIKPSGQVKTVAGAVSRGYVDATGLSARFSQPTCITIDASDIMYVADTGNSVIRKVTNTFVVSTIAGTGSKGFVNGNGNTASFDNPEGITIDKTYGTLYVADSSNNCIRKILSNGVVSTLASQYRDRNGVLQNFNYPTGIYFSPNFANLMYVSDAEGGYIHKVYTNGTAEIFAGNGVSGNRDGNSSFAMFNYPEQIWVNKDELVYVVDQQNNAIRVIDKNGNVTTVTYVSKESSTTNLYSPVGIVGNSTTGDLFIGDTGNNKIRKIDMKYCAANQYYNGTGCISCQNGTTSIAGSIGSSSCVTNVNVSGALGLIIGLAVGIPLFLILVCCCCCFAAGYYSNSSKQRGQVQPQNGGPYQQLPPQSSGYQQPPVMYQQAPVVYQQPPPPQNYGQPVMYQQPPPNPNYAQPVMYQQPPPNQSNGYPQPVYNPNPQPGYYQQGYPPPR